MIIGDRVKSRKKSVGLRNAMVLRIISDSWWDGTVLVAHKSKGKGALYNRCLDIFNFKDLVVIHG